MKQLLVLFLMCISCVGTGMAQGKTKRVAFDGATVQTTNSKIPPRVVKSGTRINSLNGSYDVRIELAK